MLERREFKSGAGDLAVVDLGSNSFHVLLARQDSGEPRVIRRLKFPVRLAGELVRSGRIGATAFAAGQAALERIADRLRGLDTARVLAVGTAALRRADDAPAFLALAEQLLGVPVEVISGEDEARMIFCGAVDTLPESSARRLVFDIGGASTELALGARLEASLAASVELGCVTLSLEHFQAGAAAAQPFEAAVARARAQLEPVLAPFREHGWDEVIATSGASEAVLHVLQAMGEADPLITRGGVQRLHEALREAPLPGPLPGLSPDRVEVFPGGAAILVALFGALDLHRVRWVEGALQDGLLRQLVPVPAAGLRRRTVDALLRRFAVDRRHGRQVADIADRLLAEVAAPLGLQPTLDGELLEAGALLHDIGMAVASVDHPRHGTWLLRHAELRGFSDLERAALMVLVRGHSGRWPQLLLGDVPAEDRSRVALLCALLRLAVLLQPAGAADVPDMRVDGGVIVLGCDADWRRRHPLLIDLLAAELQLLARQAEVPAMRLEPGSG